LRLQDKPVLLGIGFGGELGEQSVASPTQVDEVVVGETAQAKGQAQVFLLFLCGIDANLYGSAAPLRSGAVSARIALLTRLNVVRR